MDKKVRVLPLRYESKPLKEIAQNMGLSVRQVSQMLKEFKEKGLDKFVRQKQTANHRNLKLEEEQEVLATCLERAKKGNSSPLE